MFSVMSRAEEEGRRRSYATTFLSMIFVVLNGALVVTAALGDLFGVLMVPAPRKAPATPTANRAAYFRTLLPLDLVAIEDDEGGLETEGVEEEEENTDLVDVFLAIAIWFGFLPAFLLS